MELHSLLGHRLPRLSGRGMPYILTYLNILYNFSDLTICLALRKLLQYLNLLDSLSSCFLGVHVRMEDISLHH